MKLNFTTILVGILHLGWLPTVTISYVVVLLYSFSLTSSLMLRLADSIPPQASLQSMLNMQRFWLIFIHTEDLGDPFLLIYAYLRSWLPNLADFLLYAYQYVNYSFLFHSNFQKSIVPLMFQNVLFLFCYNFQNVSFLFRYNFQNVSFLLRSKKLCYFFIPK